MRLTWTSPDQIPRLQRWGMLPVFFIAGGAAGSACGAALNKFLLGVRKAGEGISDWALVGGGLGIGIGVGVLLCRSWRIRLAAVPVLTFLGFQCAIVFYTAWHRSSPVPHVGQMLQVPAFWALLAIYPLLLTGAHLAFLRWGDEFPIAILGLLYAGSGALAALILEASIDRSPNPSLPWGGLVAGSTEGLFQFGAMLVAQGFTSTRGRGAD